MIKTLIADDDPITLLLLSKILSQMDLQVDKASNGLKAWEMINEQQYDLIITDWLMPGCTGLELCQRIKTTSQFSNLFTIIITTLNSQHDAHKALEIGVDDFISKPFQPKILETRLKNIIKLIKLQKSTQENDHLISIGHLTGKIIHDLNNYYGTIRGYSELLSEKIPKNQPYSEYVNKVIAATDQSIKLTEKLHLFSKKKAPTKEQINMPDLCHKLISLFSSYQRSITLKIVTPPSRDSSVYGNRNQLEKSISSIMKNALEAVKDGGTVLLNCDTTEIDNQIFHIISVRDNGAGLTEEAQQKLFKPFYSSKPSHQGIGLTLAKEYIESNGGMVSFETSSDGTTFKILLPSPPMTQNTKKTSLSKSSTHILVIDNGENITHDITRLISNIGLHAYPFTNSQEADHFINNFEENIALIILGMFLPDSDIIKFIENVKKQIPEVKLLLTSNTLSDSSTEQFALKKNIPFISKPLENNQLKTILLEQLH